jgi:hypothetical protein
LTGNWRNLAKAAPHDEVFRGMEFEEQQLPWLERLEGRLRRGAPEVHLVNLGLGRVETKPFTVGDGDEEAHGV